MPQLKELIKKIYTLEYYSTFIKKGILSFGTTWMKPEGTMQSAISETEKQKLHHTWYHLYVQSKKRKKNIAGSEGNRERLVKSYKLLVAR